MILKTLFFLSLCTVSFANEILLSVGESKALGVPKNQSIQVGSGKILRVYDNQTSLNLIGKKVGSTYLRNGPQTWEIHVLSQENKNFVNECRDFIKYARGLELQIQNGLPIITGELLAFQDWLELHDIATKHNADYSFQPKVDSELKKVSLEHWKEMNIDFSKFQVQWDPKPELNYSDKLKRIPSNPLKSFGVELNKTEDLLEIAHAVQLEIVIAEVSRSMSTEIGIDWPTTATAQISPKLKGPESLNVLIKAAASQGEAQVLASPKLLARSGGEAEFLAGGEFPIRQTSRYSNSITWKKHGIYMKFKPLADNKGRLKLEMTTEISMIDEGLSVDNIPALKTNRISSQFDLEKAKTIVLSGLIKNIKGHSKAGLPLLYALPVLGKLFGSEKFRQHKTELIIFVTPKILAKDIR